MGSHAEEIYSEKFMWSKIDYIHLSPVRFGIVYKPSEYIYSSASNYVNDCGLLLIEKVAIPIVDVLNLNNFTKYNNYHCCPIKKKPKSWLLSSNRKFVLQNTINDEQK